MPNTHRDGARDPCSIAVVPKPRQPFLDLYRGYALLAITLNHFALVAHDEGLSKVHSFSLTPLGLSSAAEIFVLCSGYAFALAYGRLLDRAGLVASWVKSLRRSGLLLACNLLMTIASAVVIGLCIPFACHNAGSFQMAHYVFTEPGFVLRAMATLQWTPAYHDVLPLYALLLVVAPLQLYGLRHAPRATVAVSAGLWLLAVTGTVGTARIGLPTWYFHPLAWQFLFLLGMVAARFNVLERLPAGRVAVMVYLLLLAAALAFKLAAHRGMIPAELQIGLGRSGAVPLGDKLTLGPLRIAHALLLACCMMALYRSMTAQGRLLLERWLGRIGRSTLPVFVVSNPMMYLCAGLLAAYPSAQTFYALCVALGFGLLLFAIVWQRHTAKPAAPAVQMPSWPEASMPVSDTAA